MDDAGTATEFAANVGGDASDAVCVFCGGSGGTAAFATASETGAGVLSAVSAAGRGAAVLETFVGVVAGGDAFAITAGGFSFAAAEPPCS